MAFDSNGTSIWYFRVLLEGLTDEVYEEIFKCSVYFTVTLNCKTFQGNAVAVSRTKALASLHGLVPRGHILSVRDGQGKQLRGRVGLSVFQPDTHDIAVITLLDGGEFTHYKPFSRTPVTMGQPIHVVSYTSDRRGDYGLTLDIVHVRKIEANTSLFQSQYYSTEGMSGSGVIVAAVGGEIKVVGVHVGSHSTSVAVDGRRRKKRKSSEEFNKLDMATINSDIHGHGPYTLMCDPARVPEVVEFCDAD
jgi:hypothetical protein